MKTFLVKTFLFLIPAIIVFISIFFIADGKTDGYYLRFTTPRQSCLILGTSRAAQGIVPDEIDPMIRTIYPNVKMFNYSFTVVQSPYGPTYYKAIQRKLDPSTKNGVFILSIDPWAISSPNVYPDDTSQYREKELTLGKLTDVTSNPNFLYLLFFYDEPLLHIITRKLKPLPGELHKNGWMEINCPMDSAILHKRYEEKFKIYKKTMCPVYHFSKVRYLYFQMTIELLKKYGDVYLVRLPTSSRMKQMEDTLMPDFDKKIEFLSTELNVPYFNFINSCSNYVTTDGNHLYRDYSRIVSKQIADSIIISKKNKF